MSTGGILGLGAIAGFTIFLGMPVGRMRGLSAAARTFLNAIAIGILVFLIFDVLEHAVEPIDTRLDQVTGNAPGHETWAGFLGFALLLALGLGVGLLALVYYDRLLPRRRSVGGSSLGPGAASVAEFRSERTNNWSPAKRLALVIAIGIGLHNFAEGLAIGQSAAAGRVRRGQAPAALTMKSVANPATRPAKTPQ